MDWASRRVLSWRLSNTLDARFCVEALDEALLRYGKPGIFNTDQGSQFTSGSFVARLEEAGVKISMDGRGRFLDNIFIERLWRSLKYEAVYLHELANGLEARRVIGEWMTFYSLERPHSSLEGKTPAQVYAEGLTHTALSRLALDSDGDPENPRFPQFPQPPATAAAA
jgi:putative transposase